MATHGSSIDIKLFAAVPSSSGQPDDMRKDNHRVQRKRDAPYEIVKVITEMMQGREVSLRSAAAHLARQRFGN